MLVDPDGLMIVVLLCTAIGFVCGFWAGYLKACDAIRAARTSGEANHG